MYFPVLRTRQAELLALIDLLPLLRSTTAILPVLEPVNDCSKRLKRILDAGVTTCVITNPGKGPYAAAPIPAPVTSQLKHSYAIPTLRVIASTTPAQINAFAQTYRRVAFVIASNTSPQVMTSIGNAAPTFVIFCDHSRPPASNMPSTMCVSIVDRFNKKSKNDQYTNVPEPFSDRHMVNDPLFAHYGDYSIVGDTFPKTKGGGQAWTVALHHVYQNGSPRSALWIRHFVSDQQGFAGATTAKGLEALGKLVAARSVFAALSNSNETNTMELYEDLSARGHFPMLGPMKQHAIRHHLELIARII